MCEDSEGRTAEAEVEVAVTARPSLAAAPPPSVEFQLTLDHNHRSFVRKPLRRVRLVEAIAELFGDEGTDSVVLESIRAGSTIVTWSNASLPTEECAEDEVQRLSETLVDEDGQVTEHARLTLEPEFRVQSASVTRGGACATAMPAPTVSPAATEGGNSTLIGDEEDEEGNYLITFLIPAVVIAVMLLIALIVACCLYRSRRRGKMTMSDSGTYVSRGVPVIFADELEERVDRRETKPLVLSSEKPPQPPAYPAATTPMLDSRGEANGAGDAPYERPPPVAAPAENNRAGRQAANTRQPPPYVPP